MNSSAPLNRAKRHPRPLVTFIAAMMPRFHSDSIPGRAHARVAAFVSSTPGTALITLAGVLAGLIGACSGILTVARGAQSLTLLMVLIYALLIAAMGIVVVSFLLVMTILHVILGDELVRKMGALAVAGQPEYEWVRA